MKFILREGINPPSDGKMMTHPRPIFMITLQASKSHSSRTPKSEPPTYETPQAHALITLNQLAPHSFLLGFKQPSKAT